MEDMKTLRNPSKADIILTMFEDVGTSLDLSEVLQISGVKNYNSLKAMFSYIRHSRSENSIDVIIKDGVCIRVN